MPSSPILEMIGNTPILPLTHLDTGPCELFVKLENQNPGGSIKDRIALTMIEAAERSGELKPGGTIIEATAGNTGLGLALVAAQKGYRMLLVVPDKMSREKIFHLKALGAEVRLTRSDVGKGHPEYYQDLARSIAQGMPDAFYIDQFNNPANAWAHESGTGPEIWRQLDERLDAVVVGVGSGGTLGGLTRFFQRVAPEMEMILADPEGSVLADFVETGCTGEAGSWLVEGIGEDFVPGLADFDLVKRAYRIPDAESLHTARLLLKEEGVLAGSSSGTLLAAALRYCREQREAKRVLTFVCDSGNKYLSKMYNDFWMFDQGLLGRDQTGSLLDLIARRYADGSAVTVREDDTLIQAYRRMKLDDVSQLPVMQGDRLVGIIDESDILMAVHRDTRRFESAVSTAMVTELETVDVHAELDDLLPLFDRGRVAIVEQAGEFIGLITKIDVLNYLRHRIQ